MSQAQSLEKRLADAVLDLALPGEQALERKPIGSHRPDELALEFDEAYTSFVANLDKLPTNPQLESLQALDTALSAMSGPAHAELWTESSVKNHPRWAEIRTLARAASIQFGWSAAS